MRERHPLTLPSALIAVVLVTAVLAPAATAQTVQPPPEPRGVSAACPPDEELGEFPFSDVEDPTFRDEIACLAYYDITRGVTATTYAPALAVRREQMATFYDRLLQYAARSGAIEALPVYDGSNRFTDVPDGSEHVAAINRLADAGVVQGGPAGLPDDQYGPGRPVTRAQMASFVNRVQEIIAGEPFTSDALYFPDLENTAPHTDNINAIAEQQIAVGDTAGFFNPFASVTRGQMAAFIMRHVAANVEEGLLQTPAELGDVDPPALVATTPPDGATGVPVGQSVSALFDETLAEAPASTVTLAPTSDTSAEVAGDVTVLGSGITFNPSAELNPSTEYVATLNVEDEAGNTSTLAVTFSTEPEAGDTVAPSLSASTPPDGATGVPVGQSVSALFDETLAEAPASTVTLAPTSDTSAEVAGDVAVLGSGITFNPSADLSPSTQYVATFEVQDAAGNVATATVTFTTAASV